MLIARQAARGDAKTVHAILIAAPEDLAARFGQGHWSTVIAVAGVRTKAGEGLFHPVEQDSVPVGTFMLTDRKIGFYQAE